MSSPTGADLEPPRTSRLLWRGITRRCPACGGRRLFRRWLLMDRRCRRCGLRFERIEGHWIGAIGINMIFSFGALLVATIGGILATLPELPVLPLVAVNVTVAVVAPIVLHPFSRTMWTAIDIAMRPLEAHEVDWTKVGTGRGRRRHRRFEPRPLASGSGPTEYDGPTEQQGPAGS